MADIIMLIGNIGSGKSTYCKSACKNGYLVVCKDSIRYMIGGGNYVFDWDLEPYIHAITLNMVKQFMIAKKNIILDETNLSIEDRKDFIDLANKNNYNKTAIVFKKLSMEESVNRRLQSNHGNYSKEKWEEVWTRKNEKFVYPSMDEFNIILNYE